MALYRKQGSKIYYSKFDFRGKEIRRSTGVTNKKEANTVQARIRTELALGRWGILEEKQAELTLSEFLKKHFVTGEIKSKTREYYDYGIDKLLDSELAKLPLSKITKQDAQKFVAKNVRPAADYKPEVRQQHLKNRKLSPSTVNCALRTLRRALTVAHESGFLASVPKIELAKNERHRERVISESERALYLKNCVQPCKDFAILMLASGMRPDEIYRLRWEHVDLGPDGVIHVQGGKTKNAKRDIPLMRESSDCLKGRLEQQGSPADGWVFPAPTKTGHINESSIKNQHKGAISKAQEEESGKGFEYFEPYCFRHTFLSILGASGCDPYTLCRIAGHGDIQMGMRYCHTQEEYVKLAFSRMAEYRWDGVTTGGYRKNQVSRNALVLSATASKDTP